MRERSLQLNGRRILVTGAAGFIGGALTKRLLEQAAGVQVLGLDDMNDYYDVRIKKARLEALNGFPSFSFVRGDIADRETVENAFRSFRPEIVVHLAAQAGVRSSITDPDAYIRSNLVGFFNILEACRHAGDGGAAGVGHLVYASSSSVYGNNTKTPYAVEDRTDSPVSLYAATKKSGELMAHAYAKLYDIPCTGLRFFTVYGPAGRPDMAYFSFAEKLRKGERIRLFNYGDCWRDFTYIDDVTEAVMKVMERPPVRKSGEDGLPIPPFSLYNVGHGQPVRLTQFVDTLHRELVRAGVLPEDHDLEACLERVPMQPGDVAVTYADTAALERDVGARPATGLEDGLRSFARWYRIYTMERDGETPHTSA